MGAVYRARDPRLEREVAIKVLPDHLAEDPGALARFEREAKAVAALSHPNILAIHDFGVHERTAFAVMELLEGQTLRDRLRRAALSWRTTVEIGMAIADGLRAAHAKGIIHRDLKPENLFLTADGRVKILDFGLARVEPPLSATAETRSYQTALTDPGTIMGTVGYMSPEQVRGQVVDARSDLFSLGCVLYEMVTGQRAFARDTAADTLAAILYDDPPKPVGSGAPIPPELDRGIRRCLDKDPEKRFQSARDLAIALRSVTDGATLPGPAPWTSARRIHPAVWIAAALVLIGSLWAVIPRAPSPSEEPRSANPPEERDAIRSLAVLPFVYQSGDPDSEFLSDGVPMSLINSLSRVGELKVRPFSSASPFKGEAATDLAGVGRKLGVQAVLTGTIRKRGDELFIACELVDVRTNTVRPSGEPYRRKLNDLFAIQEELAHAIADQLRLQLSGEDRQELGRRPTENRDAYRFYVLGRREAEERTEAGLWKSIDHYRQAIQKDPNYALAHSGIADSYIQLAFDWLSAKKASREVKDHAMEAIRLDPALAEAHVSLGTYYLFFKWDWPEAKKELDRALKLNPNYADAYHFYCHYYEALGQMADAIAMMKQAMELDPTSAAHRAELAWVYYHARDYKGAIQQIREARETDPNYVLAPLYLAEAYEQLSMHTEAIRELNALKDREKNWPLVIMELGYAYAVSGRGDELGKILEELRGLSEQRYASPFYMAAIFVAQGRHDEAFGWLDKAVEESDPYLTVLKVEPKFDGLRSDPRYVKMMSRIGIPSP
jgi:serine/threonine protein kinase/tetratricopeptide (TPR) repeat protein